MDAPSDGAPEQAPRWDLVGTEGCGSGIRFLAPYLIVCGYVGIYRRKKYAGGRPRGPQDRGCAYPPGCALHPRGPSVVPPTYFFLLYIPMYPQTIRGDHGNLTPPPQPSVPERSHLGAFSGAPPEGALITEGLYINSMAPPMMCE